MEKTSTLSHVRALVTRPEAQSRDLALAIKQLNGQAWVMPMLEIISVEESQPMRNNLLALDLFEKVIVTSRHAARLGLNLLENYWPQLPYSLRWYAIGSSTADELKQFDISAAVPERGIDSEALLTLTDFQNIDSQKILILKGEGGRTVLQEQLKNRGALVDSLNVYRRQRPEYENQALSKRLESNRINVILCGSGETVSNLGYYMPEADKAEYLLIVPSQRVVQQATELGFQKVCSAEGAGKQAMLSALQAQVQSQL